MNKPIKVLLLDDDVEDFIPDFKQAARAERVQIIEQFTNADEGIKYLKKNHKKIDAIIVDGFFLKNSTSSHTKNKSALKGTIQWLTKLEYKEEIRIPYCIFTGYLGSTDDAVPDEVKIFKKGSSNKEMFDYLKQQVADNPVFQIKSEYEEIFELFENELMPADKEEDLVEIILKLRSRAKYNDDDAFTPIRKMYEALINEMHDQALAKNKSQDIVPEGLYNERGNLSISWSGYYLSGQDVKQGEEVVIRARGEAVWPPHVAKVSKMLIEITQEGSHDYPEDVHHYAYKSAVFALLELMLWYKDFIQSYS